MDDSLSECLDEVVSDLSKFDNMHTIGRTADEEELNLIEKASDNLDEASSIVQSLDSIRVNGRKRDNIYNELQQQSKELRRSAQLMAEYKTKESGPAEMPTAYDNVTYVIEWIEDFL